LIKQVFIFAPVSDNQPPYSELTRAIRSAGFSPPSFAREVLKVTYQGFMYRVRQNKLTLDQYHKIMAYTGKSFEELWPNPYQTKKRIPLTLSKQPPATTTVRVAPVKENKEPAIVPALAPSFSVIDVYENGLPPVE
jgi:hypothetical protein